MSKVMLLIIRPLPQIFSPWKLEKFWKVLIWGVYRHGKISGVVWNDANQNGIFEEGEQGIVEGLVKLLDENEELLASTFTDAKWAL